jgi:hypothetical protein
MLKNITNIITATTNNLSILEAANICSKSEHTIKKLLQEKKIKSTRIKGKYGFEVRIELDELINYYGANNIDKALIKKKEDKNIISDIISDNFGKEEPRGLLDQYIIDQNESYKKEIEYLKQDKEKLYQQIELREKEVEKFHVQLEKVHTLLENQQTLSLGLQTQLKSLTDNSTQNISEKPKTKHTIVQAKVSNSPQTYTDPLNFDFYDESNQVPVEAKKTPQKRRKWWFF